MLKKQAIDFENILFLSIQVYHILYNNFLYRVSYNNFLYIFISISFIYCFISLCFITILTVHVDILSRQRFGRNRNKTGRENLMSCCF